MTSRVMTLNLQQDAVISRTHAESLHREFLLHVNDADPQLSRELHGGRSNALREFTISPLIGPREVSGDTFRLRPGTFAVRFTALGPFATAALDMIESTKVWRISDVAFEASGWSRQPSENRAALTLTEAELTQLAILETHKRRDRIKLRFTSPTAFSVPAPTTFSRAVHFPDPRLLFGSLCRKFAQFCPAIEAPPAADTLASCVTLGRYSLATRRLRFDAHRTSRTGFVGNVEFLLERAASAELITWIHMLSIYSFFSGVGTGTSWGMGQVQPRLGLKPVCLG